MAEARGWRRKLGRAVLIGAGLLAGVAILEIGLQAVALVVPAYLTRAGGPAPYGDGRFRILCIGDSNTYGAGVARSDAYPAQLEQLLNGSSDEPRFAVVNLGVPGSNSAQVLHRLPDYIDLYEPDLMIVLIGVNDFWNPSETDPGPGDVSRLRLHRLLSSLRSYRLVLLSIEAYRTPETATPHAAVLETKEWRRERGGRGDATVHALRYGTTTFTFRNPRRAIALDREAHEALLRANLDEIVRVAAGRGVPLVLATYAAHVQRYSLVNRVLLSTSGAHVVSRRFREDLARYVGPPREGLYTRTLHPKGPVYAAFAASLRDALVRWGLIPTG